MPTFKFKAKNEEGSMIEDRMDARDKFELVKVARDRGLTVVFTQEVKDKHLNIDQINQFLTRVKLHEKVIFTRNLSAMIGAGISLSRALKILEKQTQNPKFKSVLLSLVSDIESGDTLSNAMKKYPSIFSSLFTSMVHAGEESGMLVEALNSVGQQLEQNYTLKKKVKGAMMYPSVVFVAMIIVTILMFIYVVPSLTATFKEFKVELPISTRIIIAISDFMAANTVVAVTILCAVFAGFFMGLRTKMGKRASDYFVIHAPVISGIVKQYNAAQTARTLSSLFSSGVSIVESLTITEDVLQNSYYKRVLSKSKDVVQKGVPLSSVFLENQDIYPILVGEMMQVGEETGKLSDMLEKIAVFYEEEVSTITKDLSTIIEPILMMVIACGVGFFAIAMITPMYTLTASI